MNLPDTRPFRLGFVYQPYAWSPEAFSETAKLLAENGDLAVFFADVGIPWPEAASGAPFSEAIEAEIERWLAAKRPGQTTVLAAGPLGLDRVSLASYYGETSNQPRPGEWSERELGDPEVSAAYTKFLLRLADRVEPDYLVYGLEVDAGLTDVDDNRFQGLLKLVQAVYPELKRARPNLPVMLEFMLEDDQSMAGRRAATRALLPYTDVYAVSTYPFRHDGIGGDASLIPADWFSLARQIAPDKPFAILETAFLAESFYHPDQGIPIPFRDDRLLIPSDAEQHRAYVERLLRDAARLDALFVSWWTPRDLDELFETLAQGDSEFSDPMWRLVQDAGLFDEAGHPRPALDVWRAWLAVPYSRDR